MKQIDKDALVAELEKRRSKNARNKLNLAAAFEDDYLLSFIDTLETKEVDLEKELDIIDNSFPVNREHLEYIAKHFFELGLKAKGE